MLPQRQLVWQLRHLRNLHNWVLRRILDMLQSCQLLHAIVIVSPHILFGLLFYKPFGSTVSHCQFEWWQLKLPEIAKTQHPNTRLSIYMPTKWTLSLRHVNRVDMDVCWGSGRGFAQVCRQHKSEIEHGICVFSSVHACACCRIYSMQICVKAFPSWSISLFCPCVCFCLCAFVFAHATCFCQMWRIWHAKNFYVESF